jgi:hypothetical protein
MEEEISWQAYEHEYIERHPDWFWFLGIIAGLAILLSILFSNFLLALIILLGAFSMAMYAKHEPNLAEYSISEKGIKAHNDFYQFKFIKSFWIQKDRQENRLVIETDRFYLPHVYIPLEDINLNEMEEFLKKHLIEKEYHNSFSEIIFEFFGF